MASGNKDHIDPYTTGYDQSEQNFGVTEPTDQNTTVQEQTPHFQMQQTAFFGNPINNAVIVPNTLQVEIEDGVQRGYCMLISAILSTLFCCLPLGIFAIIMATQAIKKYGVGDIRGGHHDSSSAKALIIMSLILGIIMIGMFILQMVFLSKN
uniref:Interferon-induced transmembrane protein 1-like n=1 Tax=Crassostrea virginica TaxID=6565 RepID=A0A8B8EAE1_CRAVI|nr:interferon-induced transmembrane protein 1-like [Crassostrea virginica]